MRSRKVQVIIALLAILVLAAALRFYGLTEQGLLLWDEGGYLCEALFLFNGLHDLDSLVTGEANGCPPWFGRPTHVALIAVMMGLVGKQDYAGLLVSALLGLSCVLVVFELARRMFGVKSALLSGLILAVLPYHVMYSREALPEADSTFFFCLGVLFYYRSLTSMRRARAFASLGIGGLFLGIAATCNYRWYPLLTIPWLLDLAVCGATLFGCDVRLLLAAGCRLVRGMRSAGWLAGPVRCLARQAVLVGAMLAPTLLWEGAFHALSWYARVRNLGQPVVKSFLHLLRARSLELPAVDVTLTDPAFYAHALWNYLGPVVFLLLLAGMVVLVVGRPKRVEGAILLALLLLPVLYFSVLIHKRAPRLISVVIPTASIVVGRAVEVTHGKAEELVAGRGSLWKGRGSWIAPSLLPTLIVVSGLVGSWPMLSVKSGNTQAALFLRERGVDRYLTSQPLVAMFYSGSARDIESIPREYLDLPLILYDRGYEHVVIDEQAYFCASAGLFSQGLLAEIGARLEPMYVASDAHKLSPQFFLEQSPCITSFLERMDLYRKLRDDRGPPEVSVYELPQDFVRSLVRPCIDLRTDAEANQLGDGWYGTEEDAVNRWRWMARQGWLLLGVEDGKNTLEITGHAVTEHLLEKGVLLQVFVNEQPIGEEWLEEGDFTLAVEVPGRLLQDQVATLRLYLGDSFTPEGEERELGVIVHSICFR